MMKSLGTRDRPRPRPAINLRDETEPEFTAKTRRASTQFTAKALRDHGTLVVEAGLELKRGSRKEPETDPVSGTVRRFLRPSHLHE